MQTLQYWQEKMKEKRKKTPFRDFLRDLCSWYSLSFYKHPEFISRYPRSERQGTIVLDRDALMTNKHVGNYTGDFFYDFQKLYLVSDRPNLFFMGDNENADYTDGCYGTKNCYLCFNVGLGFENGLYSLFGGLNSADVISSLSVTQNSNNIFQSKQVVDSMNVFYSASIFQSSDIWFSSNLIGCSECVLCQDLQHQKYCIENKAYEPDEFYVRKKEILSDKYAYEKSYAAMGKALGNVGSEGVSGRGIISSQLVENGYFVDHAQDVRNVVLFVGGETGSYNFYDGIDVGVNSHDFYGTVQAGSNAADVYCSIFVANSSNIYYSMNLDSCSYCFGCIGLQNKSYCIFNQQYTKEDWYLKVDEICSQMERDGRLGEFFPGSMNPFYFNDTAAYFMDPSFTKEEAVSQGFLWRDEPIKVDIPEWMETVKTTELDQYEGYKDGVWTIDPVILKKVILDEQGNSYRVIKLEYDFLMKYGLPLPRKHWLERMKENCRIG